MISSSFYLATGSIAFGIAYGIAYFLYHVHCEARKFQHLPWAGTTNRTWWGLLRARIYNIIHMQEIYEHAGIDYISRNQAYFLPSLIGDFIILPPSELTWALDQPDEVLNMYEEVKRSIMTNYTVADDYINDYHMPHLKTISRDLTRRLGDLTLAIVDELAHAIDEQWGTDTTKWVEVNPLITIMVVVAQTSNRVFIGDGHCRNKEITANAIKAAETAAPAALLIRAFPQCLQRFVAPIATFQNRRYRSRFAAALKPVIEARQAEILADPEKKMGTNYYNDFLQWLIENGSKFGFKSTEGNPSVIAQRLLVVNFAAIHTSSITTTNAIYDLVCNDSAIVETLRKEADSILEANAGIWTKAGLNQMYKIDSAIKEAARLHPLSSISIARRVDQHDGIVTPHSKTYCPYGSSIAFPSWQIHHNDSNYTSSGTYQPLRFADLRIAESGLASEEDTNASGANLKAANLAFSATSNTFQTFGQGRHACPGRFFASNEIKLLIAYLVQNYDFEKLYERPPVMWAGSMILPPMSSTIRVRRRKI